MTTKISGSRYLPGAHARSRHPAEQRAHQYVVEWEQKKTQIKESANTAAILSPTICFSRKIGVGALEIAEILARKTNQRVVDRLIIEKIADDADLSQKTVTFFDERHPGKMNELGMLLFGEKSFIMSEYMRKLFGAVITLAETESTIFVGRGTHLILPRDRVLAVRCISSKEFRIKRVADILGVSENAAKKELEEADKEQRRFFKKAFDKNDAPPEEFDLIINCDFLHQPEWAADVIHQAYISKFMAQDETET